MALLPRYLIAAALAALQLVHAAKDPVRDFCRRWGHQTAVVDRRLYIDGGQVTWNPMSQNPLNYTNTWFLYNDLDDAGSGMPQLHSDLNKSRDVPDLSGGVLWTDEVNKVLYLYGGEYTGATPEAFTPWAYDILLNQWNRTDVSAATGIQRVSYGAGVTVNETGVGYYLGGWLNNQTVPGWGGKPMLTSNLIVYDFVNDAWTNNTGPDNTGRGEGVMVYLPASDKGLLIYFGGVIDPFANGTAVGDAMSNIYVYDIASTKWYKQTATGDVPDMRRKFCGGATWAQDQSSYNIYIYGGQGITNTTGYDDVYILTLPSFQWIKWYPTAPGPGNPHGISSCNVIDDAQMLIIGGWFAQHQDCDSPNVWGTHNLNLGKDGPQDAMWDLFYPNITKYLVPPEIVAKIGGSSTGGATNKAPSTWDDRDLPVYFSRVPTFAARTATRDVETGSATSSSGAGGGDSDDSNTGAIVGGVVGGVGGLALVLVIAWWCLRRRKKSKDTAKEKHAQQKPAELPAENLEGGVVPELSATNSHRYRKDAGSPEDQHLTPVYPHSSGSPHTASPIMGGSGFAVSPQTQYAPGGPPGMAGGYMQPPVSPSSPQYMYPAGPPGNLPQYLYQPPPPNAQPYDPSQHALHNEHFPPPPSPQGGHPGLAVPSGQHPGMIATPSDYSRESEPDSAYPTTSSNTPAHFYPQPLHVGRNGTQSTYTSDTPLVGRISESIGSVSGSGSSGGVKQPVRGKFREEGHD
ncbi:Galactose oxidase/kelch beta-propeller [Macrophomina phaseolina MS6]|uniref:Galactose oxidase/kelch beta-propeller n=1 Tax=Macrophomina phaseolina (strain MS6) TaxID=1126212 RepID=K2R8U1_MACPH|nr:Galactose oxidase/kelch beta-propeller [Macrophomina phaseolina MS6]